MNINNINVRDEQIFNLGDDLADFDATKPDTVLDHLSKTLCAITKVTLTPF